MQSTMNSAHSPSLFRAHRALAAIGIASVILLASGCASNKPHAAPACVGCDLAELVGHMSGSFASTEQSQRDKEYFDIRLHMTPIWPQHSSPEVKWLYVEQAMATALDKPYRQRIYRITEGAADFGGRPVFVSEVFELPGDPLGFAGAYAAPKAFDKLAPDALTARDGCQVFLTRIEPGIYEGGTVGTNCPSSLRGASYATSKAHIDSTGLYTWDQGFDKDGKQVWGAVKGGYEFKRQPQ